MHGTHRRAYVLFQHSALLLGGLLAGISASCSGSNAAGGAGTLAPDASNARADDAGSVAPDDEADGGPSQSNFSTIDPATIPGWNAANWSCPARTAPNTCLKEWLENPTNPDGTPGAFVNHAFVAVVDGKIALEWYGPTTTGVAFQQPWESATKTMVGVLLGIAQDDGLLRITDPVSTYLDPDRKTPWSTTPAKEAAVTLEHLMTHTSGFDTVPTSSAGPFNSAGPPNVCSNDDGEPNCLAAFGAPGVAFRYHTGLYGLLRHVLGVATSSGRCSAGSSVPNLEQCFQSYFDQKLASVLGMRGHWGTEAHPTGYHYIGSGRDAATFGVFLANGGRWNGSPIVSSAYFNTMTNSNPLAAASNANNRSYGYLTWLAGKPDGLTPGSSPWTTPPSIKWLPGPATFAPAPTDAVMAIGAGGQYIHVTHHGSTGTPRASVVVVRLGTTGGKGFADQNDLITGIWQRMNRIICNAPPGSMMSCP
jgi:hypothetical protein